MGGNIELTPEWVSALGAIVALVVGSTAILLQWRELRLQRGELRLQRKELEAQRVEHAKNVLIQDRIADTANFQGYLDLQLRLLSYAFESESLGQVVGGGSFEGSHEEWVQQIYITCWMRLFQSGLTLGQLSEEALEIELRETLFSSPLGVRWWRRVEVGWRTEALNLRVDGEDRRKAFVDLLERISRDSEIRFNVEADNAARSGEDQ